MLLVLSLLNSNSFGCETFYSIDLFSPITNVFTMSFKIKFAPLWMLSMLSSQNHNIFPCPHKNPHKKVLRPTTLGNQVFPLGIKL